MDIGNLMVIKNLQYVILGAIILFSILSLIVIKPLKKFIFIFLFYLFSGFLYITLEFMELTFILSVPILLFMSIFYLFELKKDIFSIKNISEDGDIDYASAYFTDKESGKSDTKKTVLNLVAPVLFSALIIVLYFIFNGGYIKSFKITDKITIVAFSDIAKEVFSNYMILVIMLIISLFVLVIWSTTIINNRRKR
ncbi:hypothetical protein LLG07_01200 [bacterium]|jgi:hypothetical protein|nr:hypothetical protein [bacterium]